MRKRLFKQVEQQRTWAAKLDGGMDLTTPTLEIKEGDLLLCKNYEAEVNGGYARTGNFERFDGRAKPSEATYSMLDFDNGSTEFADGDTVTGASSGATGVVMTPWTLAFTGGTVPIQVFDTVTGSVSGATAEVVTVVVNSGSWGSSDAEGTLHLKEPSGTFISGETLATTNGTAISAGTQEGLALTSGSWVGGDAAGRLALCFVSGTFIDDEQLQVSAVTFATANGINVIGGASSDDINSRSLQHAISNTRALIEKVPGFGPVRCVMELNGEIFAMRDYSTVAELWKATTAGWVAIANQSYQDFDNGTAAISVGDVVAGATSGATSTVTAVFIKSGTTGGGNQAGRFYYTGITGTYQNNETLNVSGSPVALADGVPKTVQKQLGGRYETIVDNFTGDPADRKIYGVDGVNPAFEFDGTNFYYIPTANTVDAPDHIIAHKNYLFLSFGPSVQHSGLGTPREWTAVSGAVEIATGDDVVGFAKASGDVLAMFNRNKTYLLYGSVSTEWDRKEHSSESGAIEWSIQSVGSPVYLDDRGLMVLQSVQEYGDFKEASISRKVDPALSTQRNNVVASLRVKDKNQYRIYFSDGTGLHVRLDRKTPSFTQVEYSKVLACAISVEGSDGSEVLLAGTSDGYVIELDVGRSADGEPIEYYMRLPYWDLKSPRMKKNFTEAVLLLDGEGPTALDFTAEYDYSSSNTPRGLTQAFNLTAGGGFWGLSTWGQFVWGAQSVGEAVAYLSGSGQNVGLLVRGFSAHELGHTIQSVIVHYIPRGLKR